jgi:hypothetical protein
MKMEMPVATSPGSASGSTTYTTARKRLAPSTSTASSSSTGIVSKNARRSQSVKGRQNDVNASTRTR